MVLFMQSLHRSVSLQQQLSEQATLYGQVSCVMCVASHAVGSVCTNSCPTCAYVPVERRGGGGQK